MISYTYVRAYPRRADALTFLDIWSSPPLVMNGHCMFKIQEYISFRDLNTFKVGGSARFLADVASIKELAKAVSFAKERKLPIFVLGEGSNILVSDEGFFGFVVKMNIKGKRFNFVPNGARATVSPGENWDDFVEEAVQKNLYGIENLSGIPGSVGAAVAQNIGAYGTEVKETIESVTVFDTDSMEEKTLSLSDCQFGYRSSYFKSEAGKNLIVTSVTFALWKKGGVDIEYQDLKKFFREKNTPSLYTVRQAVLEIRKNKLPDLSQVGTAGSFFKNLVVTNKKYKTLRKKIPNLPGFSLESGEIKIPLAWIIDNLLHLKGVSKENVAVYDKQAIVLVNLHNASAKEIYNYAKKIQKQLKDVVGVSPEFEVCFVGEF